MLDEFKMFQIDPLKATKVKQSYHKLSRAEPRKRAREVAGNVTVFAVLKAKWIGPHDDGSTG